MMAKGSPYLDLSFSDLAKLLTLACRLESELASRERVHRALAKARASLIMSCRPPFTTDAAESLPLILSRLCPFRIESEELAGKT